MALSADRDVPMKQFVTAEGMVRTYAVAASTTIYKGAHVGLNVSGYARGYVAAVAAAGTTVAALTGGDYYLGIALESVNNSSGANAAKTVMVLVEGVYQHAVGSAVITDVGKPLYCSADDTLTLNARGNGLAGRIAGFVSAGIVLVRCQISDVGGALARTSGLLTLATADLQILILHPQENPNGLLLYDAICKVTTTFDTTGSRVITLFDTVGPTSLGITFTFNATAANDVATDITPGVGVANDAAQSAANLDIAAGSGVIARVTTAGAGAGAVKISLIALPN